MALLKDFSPFFCNTNKKVESKAREFKKNREGRCKNFIHNSTCTHEKQQSNLYDDIDNARTTIAEIIHSLGLVSKTELQAIKNEIDSLFKKINKE